MSRTKSDALDILRFTQVITFSLGAEGVGILTLPDNTQFIDFMKCQDHPKQRIRKDRYKACTRVSRMPVAALLWGESFYELEAGFRTAPCLLVTTHVASPSAGPIVRFADFQFWTRSNTPHRNQETVSPVAMSRQLRQIIQLPTDCTRPAGCGVASGPYRFVDHA